MWVEKMEFLNVSWHHNLVVPMWDERMCSFDVFYISIWMIYTYMFYYVSSPYLLVFDDDHVCNTRDQMIL